MGCAVAAPSFAFAQPATPRSLLLSNVRIFDGVNDQLRDGHVLVFGDKIEEISSSPIQPPAGTETIDGGARVLMPGLTDAHWHMVFAPNTLANMEASDTGLMYANAVAEAERTLMRGFTTIRDVGGPTFGLKQAIDSGAVPGPRVYPSGALISQTAGHGDFAPAYAQPRSLGSEPSRFEQIGAFVIADGVPDVMAAVRAQLKRGASQIKLALGGGVISDSDPIDTLQYTPEEIRAAVQVASDWGTYVATHVYTVAGIHRAIDAGVRSIEHGHMVDEQTLKLMAEQDVWLSLQPFEAGDNPLTPEQIQKAEPTSHWDRVAEWAKAQSTKVAFGTDLLFQPDGTGAQPKLLSRFARVFGNSGALRIATSGNCDLFALSGERNPYKGAKLGVLERGAWADMLLVNGDPTQDIDLLTDYERNLAVIIKGGEIFKNTLPDLAK
ncbi:metal-dependent hydrolase family protein [Aquamicrobium zhengzhouense]|uniref:Amidohydrolase family protein n=1 Tax=Aquamicrobium zhengzhouense TaxID=2781738 RepID=A0ABS0SHQ1_9HYPH|nr:amidohydrolase family protein [Aquamicrobium zhengzhouense]MBI1622771.1 amidohydrolase family protein [Aquamicrobium zhengzhouense]